jgi:hypothetical protein
MKMNLRSTAEEGVPHTVLLSACIEQCTTFCYVSCPGAACRLSVRDQQLPVSVNLNARFAPELIGTGDMWEHKDLGYHGRGSTFARHAELLTERGLVSQG